LRAVFSFALTLSYIFAAAFFRRGGEMFDKLKSAVSVSGWIERCSEVDQHIHIADQAGALTYWFKALDETSAGLLTLDLKSVDDRLNSAGVSTYIMDVFGCRRIG
jgi:hypothetical protein